MYKDNLSYAKTFKNFIFYYLKASCNQSEDITDTDDYCYTKTGIKALNIIKDSFIYIEYVTDINNFSINSSKYSKQNTVLFLNVEKSFLINKINGVKVFCIDDLDINKKISPREDDLSIRKRKIISHLELDKYVKLLVRIKVLSGIGVEPVSPNLIKDIAATKNPFPFEYKGNVYYSENVSIKNHIKRNNDYKYYSIQVNENIDGDKEVSVNVKKIEFGNKKNTYTLVQTVKINKVQFEDFYKCLPLIEKIYTVEDFFQIYKYRQFEQINKDKSTSIYISSDRTIENNEICFSKANQLNDPFDLITRTPKKFKDKEIDSEIIRASSFFQNSNNDVYVFCSTNKKDNILMWSHYADSHKGMCTMYYENELLQAIDLNDDIGICLYGNVNYLRKRQNLIIYKYMLNYCSLHFLVMIFNLKNLFIKYKAWEYEKENRFVLLPKMNFSLVENIILNLKPRKYYFGSRFNKEAYEKYLREKSIIVEKMKMDDSKYRLY